MLSCTETMFHEIRAQPEAQGLDPWAPFADTEEWGLVKWLVSHVGQNVIDEFMKLPITSSFNMSFTSKYTLMKAIDQLPCGMEWQLKRISVEGNKLTNDQQCKTEELELWLQDPVDCIHELMANPEFNHMVSYVPERVFSDTEGKTRQFDEMWTGDWWWEMQGRLPQGAVVAPVILASDKTSLLQFRGDQEVWPPSKHATILITYLPISKLECFTRDTCSLKHYQPLVRAGVEGVNVTCPDRQVRWMYPIVAACCLVACCMENRCPKCVVGRNECGDMGKLAMHNQDSTVENLRLHSIYSPFWATLPHNDIFSCLTPDILHQLHKGVFKDHIEKLDTRFKEMMSYSGLRHFKKGISKHKQWTGCVFLSVIAGVVDHKVLTTVHGMHTDDTLACMHAALTSFHANKNHFNILKIHSMIHYIDVIRILGSADGFNTELPEWLHIDFAKWAYCASNWRNYSIHIQDAYLQWWGSQHPVNQGSNLLEQDSDTSGSDSESDSAGPENSVDLPSQVQQFTMVTDQVDVYKYCKILSPARPHINNRKLIPASDVRRPPAPAHFDSVLVIEDGNDKGRFPSHLGNFPHPLAYIHWFWLLQSFDENLHSFHLTRSSHQCGPNALVVLVHQVLHPCHLIPWVGRELDMQEEFYLNRYIDLELFKCLSKS
ncbi:uncharacterized protein EDB91DRAFT_1234842 [Suillus paluster]|uniref:uncharacterized protein n=1 Tax=Suillus paluster TaxID=48578 RepID=UPI001B86854B|nr:uncharacterized protein EDB91DRAFT_1234842 [Suillus paluster]KAG1751472.1 hypothetical protein EDB91DRAFT_1234842 [Suillus paluster]